MKEKFKSAVGAGIICGIVLVLLSFLYFIFHGLLNSGHIMNATNTPTISFSFTIVILALDVFTFFCAGVLSARLTSRHISNLNDAIIIGAITAAVGELINLPFTLVLSFITEYLWPSITQFSIFSAGESAAISTAGQLVCCFPVMLIVGIIISIIGAVAYTLVKQ